MFTPLKTVKLPLLKLTRQLTTEPLNNLTIPTMFVNRNPRNLERLRIGYKPDGYHVERPGRNFWHRLNLEVSNRHVTALVEHFQRGPILRVSTLEWAIRHNLYLCNDATAYINLGRVFVERCLKTGLLEMTCNLTSKTGSKVEQFLNVVQNGGITLKEAPQFKVDRPWDQYRKEKPWEVQI